MNVLLNVLGVKCLDPAVLHIKYNAKGDGARFTPEAELIVLRVLYGF